VQFGISLDEILGKDSIEKFDPKEEVNAGKKERDCFSKMLPIVI
jgi:hypothetical protein